MIHIYWLSALVLLAVFIWAPNEVTDGIEDSYRVAIVGAGIAGSSTAFCLSKLYPGLHANKPIYVDVYESSSIVGGRSSSDTVSIADVNFTLDMGSSFIFSSDRNLRRYAKRFGLELIEWTSQGRIGLWNGRYLTEGILSSVSTFQKYGLISTHVMATRSSELSRTISKLRELLPSTANLSSIALDLNFAPLVNTTAANYFVSHGVHLDYIKNIVNPAVRMTYGKNVDEVSALYGILAMDHMSAFTVSGGISQLPQRLLGASNATVSLNDKVKSIQSVGSRWVVQSHSRRRTYDAVIIATPLRDSDMGLPISIMSKIPTQEYDPLHVTVIHSTSARLDPRFFITERDRVVRSFSTVMTTTREPFLGPQTTTSWLGLFYTRDGVEPAFYSIMRLGQSTEGGWLYKIYSAKKIKSSQIARLFASPTIVGYKMASVLELLIPESTYLDQWDSAYLHFTPSSTMAPLKLADGLYYAGGFERIFSSMEGQTIVADAITRMVLTSFQAEAKFSTCWL